MLCCFSVDETVTIFALSDFERFFQAEVRRMNAEVSGASIVAGDDPTAATVGKAPGRAVSPAELATVPVDAVSSTAVSAVDAAVDNSKPTVVPMDIAPTGSTLDASADVAGAEDPDVVIVCVD